MEILVAARRFNSSTTISQLAQDMCYQKGKDMGTAVASSSKDKRDLHCCIIDW